MHVLFRGISASLACSLALAFSGCGPGPSTPVAPQSHQVAPPASATTSVGLKEKQMEFLNRIRQADPQFKTIDRALLNEQNELGLILDRSVEMDKIPALMRTMLAQMAKAFPGEDLTVLAYTPSAPPHKIGTARLNARTRDMTYTPAN